MKYQQGKFMKTLIMFISILLITVLFSAGQSSAQYGAADNDIIKAYTSLWKGERFTDGRPKVSDDILERMKLVETEEAWGVMRQHGFELQFEGNWYNIHPERTLVGRALTTTFVPKRPDINAVTDSIGHDSHHPHQQLGRSGTL